MYKVVLVATLVLSILAFATVIPSTAQAYSYYSATGYSGHGWGNAYPAYGYGYGSGYGSGYGYGCGYGYSGRGGGLGIGGTFRGMGFGNYGGRGWYGGYYY